MNGTKILVFGDDSSPGADVAWSWVRAQAWPGWRAEVVTAVMPPIGPPPAAADSTPHAWEPPVPRLAPSSEFADIVHLLADADPRYVLGERVDAALVVVGPTGVGFLKVLHLGSTTDHLVHHPPAPLLIARNDRPVRRVLAAIDGSDHAQYAVEKLAAMPWFANVESVAVVMVSDDDAGATEVLERASAVLGGVSVRTQRLPSAESKAEAILAAADVESVDLVVVGTRGVGPLQRLLAGSTATAIVERAPCSVLMARVDAD